MKMLILICLYFFLALTHSSNAVEEFPQRYDIKAVACLHYIASLPWFGRQLNSKKEKKKLEKAVRGSEENGENACVELGK